MSMKERPILFSGPMVRAILNGSKTQTRRIVKPQPEVMYEYKYAKECKFGKPGDRLWVRETFTELRPWHEHDITRTHRRGLLVNAAGVQKVNCVEYKADATDSEDLERCRKELGYKWKPSIHMPRWASRITLEITSILIERLQDISEEDAQHEGVDTCLGPVPCDTYTEAFEYLWGTINGAESWAANPWVWVIGFKRVPQ